MISSTLSHYKILEELGRGGMGIVYMADDINLYLSVATKWQSLLTRQTTDKCIRGPDVY